MKLLLILNRKPYDGTDVTWNALRLVSKSLEMGMSLNIFFMNESVELACSGLEKSESYDLQEMLLDSIDRGVKAKVCETCLKRTGIEVDRVMPCISTAVMTDLVEWIRDSDQTLTF